MKRQRHRASRQSPLARLTSKQLAILDMLSNGFTQKETADQLKGSLRTIEVDLRLARARLGARTTGEAIAIFAKHRASAGIPT